MGQITPIGGIYDYLTEGSMTPQDITAARQRLGLTQAGLADRIGTTQSTVSRWEAGRVPISRSAERLIEIWLAERIDDRFRGAD